MNIYRRPARPQLPSSTENSARMLSTIDKFRARIQATEGSAGNMLQQLEQKVRANCLTTEMFDKEMNEILNEARLS